MSDLLTADPETDVKVLNERPEEDTYIEDARTDEDGIVRDENGKSYSEGVYSVVETARVRIWLGRNPHGEDYSGEPDEVHEIPLERPYIWQDSPHFNSPPMGIDIHPDDCPMTLYIHSEDSVRPPAVVKKDTPKYFDRGKWGRAVERGLPFYDYDGDKPFGMEIWGRVLFYVEEGNTRD